VEARLKLGVTLIRETREDDGLAEIRKYLEASGPKDDVAYAKKILANPRVARDAMAPEFSVPTADGGQFSLTANAGRIVVIDFWATWCPPCRESVPEIKELLRKYPADKLVVLSASADKDEKTWRSFISKKEMTWPQFFDKDGRLAEMFGVDGYPTYVVIDRDRFIRKRLVGMNPQETIAHKLRDELKSVLE
jgi:peroxiredoxin